MRTFTDVDECQSDTDGCQHNCTNTDGSYECYCLDGYRLDTDNHSCTGEPMDVSYYLECTYFNYQY